jgi:hypothetical protein
MLKVVHQPAPWHEDARRLVTDSTGAALFGLASNVIERSGALPGRRIDVSSGTCSDMPRALPSE